MAKQECPLCKTEAEFGNPPYGTSNKCFDCDRCGRFVISPEAERLLVGAPERSLVALSSKAKQAPANRVLAVFAEKSSEGIDIRSKHDEEDKWF